MRFAKRVFRVAGIYGLVALLPMYFFEEKIGRDTPPAITHPEFFYGFVGVAVAWQVAFLIMARDPARYRPLIPAGVIEKVSFGFAAIVLYAQHRLSGEMLAAGCVDLILAGLFIASWIKLGHQGEGTARDQAT